MDALSVAVEPQVGDVRAYDQVIQNNEGGFVWVSPSELLSVTWHYLENKISGYEYRTWWAALEYKKRRRGRAGDFACQAEWARLTGVNSWEKTRKALNKLSRVGLLSWSRDALSIKPSTEHLTESELESFHALYRRAGKATQRRLPIPVPRHITYLLARESAGKAKAAVIAGLLLRIIRRKKAEGDYVTKSGGFISPGWVSRTFGISDSSAKRVMGDLAEVGLVRRLTLIDGNRRSTRTVLNLDWRHPDVKKKGPILNPARGESGPISDPRFNEDPSLQGRQNQDSEVKARHNAAADSRSGSGVFEENGEEQKQAEPRFVDIKLDDLEDIERAKALHRDFVNEYPDRGMSLHTFVAVMQWALRATRREMVKGNAADAVRLFRWAIMNAVDRPSLEDQELANKLLKESDDLAVGEGGSTQEPATVELSADAVCVGHALSYISKSGSGEKVGPLLCSTLGWEYARARKAYDEYREFLEARKENPNLRATFGRPTSDVYNIRRKLEAAA